jgi:hypothetical protein
MRCVVCFAFLVLVALPLVSPGQAPAPGWGDLKGQVLFGGPAIPAQAPIAVPNAAGIPCVAKNPPVTEEYVVDTKTKGVKWVFVALVDPDNPRAALPVNPAVQKALPKTVSFDQPCCTFEPHVLGVVAGQNVEVKNSAAFPHNAKIDGGNSNPNDNILVPPNKSAIVPGQWKASASAVPVTCGIHPWMKMWIRVYPHPYFAVTDDTGNWEIKDAPAGNWNLVIWHEGEGWGPGGKTGVPVTVVAGKMTSVGVSKIK